MKKFFFFFIKLQASATALTESQNWTGYTESYRTWKTETCRKCIAQYRTYCALWRNFKCYMPVTKLRCSTGWTHNGDYNCSIPICKPNCGSVGECVAPGKCDCKGLTEGQYCQELLNSSPRNAFENNGQ